MRRPAGNSAVVDGGIDRSTQQTLLAAVTVTGFLTAFSMSGVNVALEQIASELKLSAVSISWVTLAVILGTGALSIVSLIAPLRKLRGLEWREPKTAPFDIWGSVVWVVALSALIIGFSYLPTTLGYVLIATGVVGLIAFVYVENRAADPILNVGLLRRNRVFASANAVVFIDYSATTAATFLVSLHLLYTRRLDPQTAGFVLVTGSFVQAAVVRPGS